MHYIQMMYKDIQSAERTECRSGLNAERSFSAFDIQSTSTFSPLTMFKAKRSKPAYKSVIISTHPYILIVVVYSEHGAICHVSILMGCHVV